MVANEDHVAEQGPPEAYKIKNMKKRNLCWPRLIMMFNIPDYLELKCNCSYNAKI